MASLPSIDPVSIWARSQVLDDAKSDKDMADSFVKKTLVAERYGGQRSMFWTSISEMTGPNRQHLVTKMIKNWPYVKEKYAMTLPLHVGVVSTCFCASVVACKINADLFLMNPKAGFLETVRKAPKSTLVFPIYATGIFYFTFYNAFVMPEFVGEDTPCPSCALSRLSAIAVASGTLFPALTSPALAHYVNMQRNPEMPATKNLLEFVTMLYTASKPAWSVLPKLAVLQLVVAAAGTYSLLWGRNRIFGSVDVDPDMITEALVKAQNEKSLKKRLNWLFNNVAFLKPFADDVTIDADRN